MLDKFDFEIVHYFPLDKVDWGAGTYDQYLYDLNKTVEDNFSAGNYQVAFFYSHLLFMAYAYYCVENCYTVAPKRALDVYFSIKSYSGNDNKPDLTALQKIYDLSVIPEKEVFKIFHAIDMPSETIKKLSKYVSDRDDFAHATGKGNIDHATYRTNISNIMNNVNEIHKSFRNTLETSYMNFLLDSYSKEYTDFIENAENYIIENSCSFADLFFICNIGISRFRVKSEDFKNNYRYIKKRHLAFVLHCKELYGTENKRNTTDDEYAFYFLYRYKNDVESYLTEELQYSNFSPLDDKVSFSVLECPECEQKQLAISPNGGYLCFACEKKLMVTVMAFVRIVTKLRRWQKLKYAKIV